MGWGNVRSIPLRAGKRSRSPGTAIDKVRRHGWPVAAAILTCVLVAVPSAQGAQAASVLQIETVGGHVEVYLGEKWFNVVGILKPVLLDSSLSMSATDLVQDGDK